jgi:phosphonate transport system substrate-binding protein
MKSMACAVIAVLLVLPVSGCGSSTSGQEAGASDGAKTLRISAIPDQDPEQLQRLYPVVADYLGEALDVKVVYKPVTDYAASVTGFKVGDLDLVWFGGLTGVQARAQVEGESVLAQRDVDTDFHTVFIANAKSGLRPVSSVEGLSELRDRRFTFGSESSTSGRLMPEYFLRQAGLSQEDFKGAPGFSGSHDTTIAVVESGAYEAGALNEQVWKDRLEEGAVNTSKVKLIWRSSGYHDYHWVGAPDLDESFGDGFTGRLRKALLAIDGDTAREKKILELFGAGAFVPVGTDEHGEIQETAKELGLLDKAGA